MSSLSRKRIAPVRVSGLAVAVSGALALGAAGSALAAETYIKPEAELRVETSDNFNLLPQGDPDGNVTGYIADLRATFGYATQRGQTSFRPRVKFQEYPDRDEFQNFEGFVDLVSYYTWDRARFDIGANYAYEDSYNADTPSGVFDPLDPNGGYADSGRLLIGETRSRLSIRPQFAYELSERTSLGLEIQYDTVDYNADRGQSQTDYDYYVANPFLAWDLDERSIVTAGVYTSKYSAKDNSSDVDTLGAELGYRYLWSEVVGFEATILFEQNDTTDYVPVRVEDSQSSWGGTITAYRKGEVSEWRVTAGHTFVPTGGGGKSESDQIRIQYDRDITPRLSFTGAGRAEARNSLGGSSTGDDRDFVRIDTSLNWRITPVWFLRGGYRYTWQDRNNIGEDADNNTFFIGVGYQGLGQQSQAQR